MRATLQQIISNGQLVVTVFSGRSALAPGGTANLIPQERSSAADQQSLMQRHMQLIGHTPTNTSGTLHAGRVVCNNKSPVCDKLSFCSTSRGVGCACVQSCARPSCFSSTSSRKHGLQVFPPRGIRVSIWVFPWVLSVTEDCATTSPGFL